MTVRRTVSRPLREVIQETAERIGGQVLACSYGVHTMVYERDADGKIVSSTCSACGASYSGFHF